MRSADYMNINYGGWSPQVGGALNGNGYMGFASYGNGSGSSEAIGQFLSTDVLEKNKSYRVRVSAKSSSGGFYDEICGGVGVYGFASRPTLGLSSTHPEDLGGTLLWTSDTVKSTDWESFEGCFTPKLEVNYVVFSLEKVINCPQYIYLDDITIEKFSDGLDLGKDTSLCSGDTLVLDAGVGASEYEWNDGSILSTLEVTESGFYSVKKNIGGCSESDQIQVNFNPLPNLPLGADTFLCEQGVVELDATTPNANYLWKDGETTATLKVDETGVYWVKIETNGCSVVDTIEVSILTSELDLGKDSIMCPGNTMLLDAENHKSSYLWHDGSQGSTFNATPPGLFWVEVTNVCDTLTDTIHLETIEPVSFSLGRDTAICPDSFLTVQIEHQGLEYQWWNQHSDALQEISPPQIVSASLTNVCQTVHDTLILSALDCDCRVFMANAFTPNSDTINQVFRPKSHCGFQEYRFQVFNRWGERIVETEDPSYGWDGTFRGQQAPVGVYVYVVTYRQEDKVYRMKKGNVTLVR